MAIHLSEITPEQRDLLLARQEGHFLDFKSTRVAPSKLTEAISALANTDGGELYIGIEDTPRSWDGFENQEAANGHLQIFERLFPLGGDFSYEFLACSDAVGLVLKIEVLKTRDIKTASNGDPYIRRGAQSLRVTTPEMLRRLEYTKGIASFETECLDVDPDRITNSVVTIGFMLQVVPTSEPADWLRKQQLLRDNRPTVAGVVLFDDEPQASLPKRCGIKVYRYQTSADEGSRDTMAFDPITVEGSAYEQIAEAVRVTTATIEDIRVLGEEGLEEISYPPEALHEIITNAVIHRDYSHADDIHIRIFDNRVEVESPGRLPAHVTVENILDERFARNGAIVRILNKFPTPPNKDIGEGLNTAFDAMRKLGLKDPRIIEKERSVLVLVRHEPLASPEELIMEWLENNDTIRNSEAREICNIEADWIVKGIFQRMIEANLIERVPGTRFGGTKYRKKVED